MNLHLFLLTFLIFLKTISYSQNIISIKEQCFPYFLDKVVGSKVNAYKLIEPYKSCYLELKPNGTFFFYDINSVAFYVCVGNYSINKPFVRLNWDSIPTYKLVEDSIASAKIFRYKKAVALKIKPTVYLIKEKGLESLNLKYDKIELLFSSDYSKKGTFLDSLISIQYTNFNQKKIIVKRYKKEDLIFKKDSITGFRIYKDSYYKTFRNDTACLKWNLFPGYQIAQIENGLIIYQVENSTKTYYYYFSKTLTSEIYPINKANLSREYSHMPGFLDEVEREFKLKLNYGSFNEVTNNFRLAEIYRIANGELKH